MTRRRLATATVKAAHTAAFVAVEAAIVAVIADGLRGRRSRWTAAAGTVVAGEVAAFLAAGARCPLTLLLRHLEAGDPPGRDIYLPEIVASNVTPLHLGVLALAVRSHLRP